MAFWNRPKPVDPCAPLTQDELRAHWRRKYVHNRHKVSAQHKVFRALKNGRLIRPPECSCCRRPCKPQAHHADYTRPLDVVWVCAQCHNNITRGAP